ncbi:MAG TPA: DUF5667 domain-containing protein [Micromonosporaceae bacterium]|nr:DUF5667 domain-containing protein [Micromonosporaceae bacterium]
MNAAIFERRRAERLAQLLDDAAGGPARRRQPHPDAELAPLVTVAERLAQLRLDGEPDADFRAGLRAMLLATAERDGIGRTATAAPATPRAGRPSPAPATYSTRRPAGSPAHPTRGAAGPARRPRLRGRETVIVGVAAGMLALSGMSAASGDAIPGDPLYPVKRSTERAQLALTSSDISRGQLYLEFAKTRMSEARAVRDDPALLARVLADTDAQTRQGVRLLTTAAVKRQDPTALDMVDRFVNVQRDRLSELLATSGGAPDGRVAHSQRLLQDVAGRSADLRTAMTCGAGSEGSDILGPKPGACHAAGPGGVPPAGPGTPQATPAASDAGQRTPSPGDPAPGAAPSAAATTPPVPEGSVPDTGSVLDGLGRLLDDLLGG